MSSYCIAGKGNCLYSLQSIIIHEGSISSGHYYCYNCIRREGGGDRWCLFNDYDVKEVNIQSILEEVIGNENTPSVISLISDSEFDSLTSSDSDSDSDSESKQARVSTNRLRLPGGLSTNSSKPCPYILIYVKKSPEEEILEKRPEKKKNKNWLYQSIIRSFSRTIWDYYNHETKRIAFYSCHLLNSQRACSFKTCKPLYYYCWNKEIFTKQTLVLYGTAIGVPTFSQVSNAFILNLVGMVFCR